MKVEIKRDVWPNCTYPHDLRVDGGLCDNIGTEVADAIQALIDSAMPDQSDLPEGFIRLPEGKILAPGDAWNAVRESGVWERLDYCRRWCSEAGMWHAYYEVRRTPQTERVHWYEAKGRTLPDGRLILEVSQDGLGPKVRVGSEWIRCADGMVEVRK